jgi:hypothetical protein
MKRLSYVLAALLVAALALISPASAAAGAAAPQSGRYDDQRYAYDYGYREGVDEGARDARDGRPFDVRRHDEYRDGDRGYDRRYGNRGQYKQAFRDGFSRGYNDGYGQYGRSGRAVPRDRTHGYPDYGQYPNGRYPGSSYPPYPNRGPYGYPTYPGGGGYGYYSPARDKGFADGYDKGLDDGHDGDRFEPEREKWYREGDRGYKSSYGSRDRYKVEYREAFRQGYEQGYSDGRGGYRGTQSRRLPWPF